MATDEMVRVFQMDAQRYKAEADKLGALIAEHNSGCVMACEARGDCRPYTSRGRKCPDCPKDWMIELPADQEGGEHE